MDIRISPSRLSGSISAISSKSDAHRALICAALSDAPTELVLNGSSVDIQTTIRCLQSLGAAFSVSEHSISVSPMQSAAKTAALNCEESGSTLRFLLPVAAALGCQANFTGRGRLPERPVSPLKEELEAHGCRLDRALLPIALSGQLQSGVFTLPGNVSSQFLTGLLLCFPLLPGGGEIALSTALESAGYVEMTIQTMRRFGVDVRRTERGFRVAPGQQYRSPGRLEICGDWSSGAFWLCAGALSGEITCRNLDAHSAQGDRAVEALLAQMGAQVCRQGQDVTVRAGALSALSIDAGNIPDLIPVLAAVAATASGQTRIVNAARLRIKESDRLRSVTDTLRRLGAEIEELPDGLIIRGKPRLAGGEVSSWGDHRIAMSAAIASLACEKDVIIRDAQVVSKSYPGFWADFEKLGGKITTL